MNKLRFSINIHAPRENVWHTLWDDKTLREWAGLIDPGTYMVGELKEGNEVQFLSGSGYGVTSLIEKLIPNELVSFRHLADTKDSGVHVRDKEWTGGTERYALTENDNSTTLTYDTDLPPEQEEYFKGVLPKALERIKFLTEKNA